MLRFSPINVTVFSCFTGRDLRHAIEEVQVELDQKKWRVAQKVEHMYSGDNFTPPRIVVSYCWSMLPLIKMSFKM